MEQVSGQLGLHREILSLKKNTKKLQKLHKNKQQAKNKTNQTKPKKVLESQQRKLERTMNLIAHKQIRL